MLGPAQPMTSHTSPRSQRSPSAGDRQEIAALLMKLFALWQLGSQEQRHALGLSPGNRSALPRLRRGAPLAANRDTIDRAGHLLRIHKNLRLLFPQNRELVYRWIRARNRAFENRSPIEVIADQGFAGLLVVSYYLERRLGE